MTHMKNTISQMKMASRISSTKQNLAEIKEKAVFAENLQTTLDAKNTEIEKLKLHIKELSEKYKQALLNHSAYKVKYYQIEEDNENNIKSLKNQIEQITDKMKQIEHLNDGLSQQLNEAEIKYQQLCEKSVSQAETIKKLESQFIQHDIDLENAKKTYETQLQSAQEKANVEINNIRNEIEKTKKELQEIVAFKESIIKEKCKIITEQSYKMREIEKVFGRPITCVPKFTCETNTSNEMGKVKREGYQSKSSTPHSPTFQSKLCNTDLNKNLTKKPTRKRRLILRSSLSPSPSPPKIINLYNEEDNSDNNDDSDNISESTLVPYRANSMNFNINGVTSSNLLPNQSAPTNTSDVFDILKRSNK